MRRRAFLAATGITALAGCSSDDGSTTATATPTTTATGTGDPSFELQRARILEPRALNAETAFVLTVQNSGSSAGTFTSELEMKVGDGEWSVADQIELSLAPGETGDWQSATLRPQYLSTLRFRVPAFDETWAVDVDPATLAFGERYVVPNGLFINVLGGSFESAYPTGEDGGSPTQAPDGEKWAIMRLDVRNSLEEPLTTPPADTFTLEVGGETRSQHQAMSDDPYTSGELGGRTVQRGDLVYAVPEDTRASDIRVVWTRSLSAGDVKAVWTV